MELRMARTGPCPSFALAVAFAVTLGATPAFADSRPGRILSTGVASNQSLIPFGEPDDDWTLISAPLGVALGPATVVSPARPHFTDFGSSARWISPSSQTNVDAPFGLYTYAITFGMGTRPLGGKSIEGQYASDNRLIDIRVNGQLGFVGPSAGVPCPSITCSGDEFSQPINFSLPALLFKDGLNTIHVTIENLGPTRSNPTSFAWAAIAPVSPVPEPNSTLLMALGLMGIGAARRASRRGTEHDTGQVCDSSES